MQILFRNKSNEDKYNNTKNRSTFGYYSAVHLATALWRLFLLLRVLTRRRKASTAPRHLHKTTHQNKNDNHVMFFLFYAATHDLKSNQTTNSVPFVFSSLTCFGNDDIGFV